MPYRSNNYSFVIDANFKPFTMQEMLVPFLAHKEASDKQMAAWDEVNRATDVFSYLEDTLKDNPDSVTAQVYKRYADAKNKYFSDFAKNGISMNNLSAFVDLKRRYPSEIGRLEIADKAKKAQWKEQSDIRSKDPTAIFSRRADSTSLDDYYKDPNLTYDTYSGALLAKQVSDAVSTIGKRLSDSMVNGKIDVGRLDNYTKTWIEDRGLSPEQVYEAIYNPTSANASPILKSIVNSAVESSGIPRWGNDEALDDAYTWARQGLWSAVGQNQIHTFKDEAAAAALADFYDQRKQQRAYDQALKMKQLEAQQAMMNGISINPVNIFSSKERDSNLKNFSRYFTEDADGKIRMTPSGIKEYQRQVAEHVSTTSPGTGLSYGRKTGKTSDSPFKEFIDSIGGAEYIESKDYNKLGELWQKYKDEHGYDATKSTEFDFRIYKSQQEEWKNAILAATNGAPLDEVDFNSKTNSFTPTGDKLDVDKLNSDKYIIQSTKFSPYGSTMIVIDDKGKEHRYRLPKGINPTNEYNRDLAMQNALIIQNALSEYARNGYYTDNTGQKVVPTEGEIEALSQKYYEFLQRAYLHHSQLGVTNKVKEQEYNPYSF